MSLQKKIENNNIFTSKSDVLKFLSTKIKKSHIEFIYDFTVFEWKQNRSEIIENILQKFSKPIIVRSSAIGEDSVEGSEAGVYDSILNVDPNSKNSVVFAINEVIKSYKNKNNSNTKNQILIQKQTLDISTSGVIFSRNPSNGSPYFIINFEKGGSTTGVTHGSINDTVKIFRNIDKTKIPNIWKKLVDSIKEIELLLKSSSLDIEFGISKSNKIIIFQVRPLTTVNHISSSYDKKIQKLLLKIKNSYSELSKTPKVPGKSTIYSDMADWNPSEIIGNNPNPLDFSLYDYLVLNDSWYKGRIILGYQNLPYGKLMVKFGNKPYIDTRKSFNSLIPSNIDQKLIPKLIDYYMAKLSEHPDWHDKVEFDILFTCYTPDMNLRLNDLQKYNFSKKEIVSIKNSLIDFTNNIFKNYNKINESSNNSIEKMKKNRISLMSNIESSTKSYKNLLSISEQLLFDCKNFGIIPFSTMARLAFVAAILLKNLVKQKYLTQEFVDKFMNTINSPLSDFREDLLKYSNQNITKSQILKKYGHLRPGTYDINAIRYDSQNDFFNDVKFDKIKKSSKKIPKTNIKNIFKNKFGLTEIDFFIFCKKSIESRENLKFEFTRNLSDALELISVSGEKLGFTRDDLSFLNIDYIFSTYKKYDKSVLKNHWRKKIQLEKTKKLLQDSLILPPLILSKNDFETISYYRARPNFITSKKITSKILYLKNSNNSKIEDHIVLLNNADPGYDWVFAKNPSALITKYGGVASHMAIRCAEIGLPAAIGCGELLFEQLKKSSKILLDCKNEKITILENKKIDPYFEEKKILKSLGYIK